ncbi:MAG: serine hydrolase [Luteitalea sp.]|nr:serine hydrolase [Luteitalea sp.]
MTRKPEVRPTRQPVTPIVWLGVVVAAFGSGVLAAKGIADVAVPTRARDQSAVGSATHAASHARSAEASYFPPRGSWQQQSPDAVGMDKAALDRAIAYAVAHENPATKDLALERAAIFGQEPFDDAIGPMRERAALNGLIVRHGYVVAEWGDTARADMTFSVTKSFLSTVVGLAWQRGFIHDVKDRVVDYMPTTELFDTPHNAKITWEHLLRQTSDWRGTLWDKPDWADRPEGNEPSDYPNRPLHEPGTHYKYNDTRVNVLALAALHVWRKPLPRVLREEVMDPIGASSTWRWHGYRSSWVELDGQRMQSVSGGGHWGGGMFISARDMMRFGYLFLRNGRWVDQEIVSDEWIQMARTPGPANRTYGFMNWFLNTDRKPLPSAPASAVTFRGAGNNVVYIDWTHDLVVVVRWIQGDALDSFLGHVLAAVR